MRLAAQLTGRIETREQDAALATHCVSQLVPRRQTDPATLAKSALVAGADLRVAGTAPGKGAART